MIQACDILFGKPEGKRPLGRSRHRWEDNIRLDLREVGWEGVDWIHLAQDRDHWWAFGENNNETLVPYKTGNFLIS
jgi:hypothetical protein